ncbi:MAG: hypothetical protein AB1896_15150 [Thermodesulfobacteriota bacterium]
MSTRDPERFIREFEFRDHDPQPAPGLLTRTTYTDLDGLEVPVFLNEFWTSRQR